MFEVNEENGDITLRQGDSGVYTISGLPTDTEDYEVYFQAQDENRKNVGEPVSVACNGEKTVIFSFTGGYTDIFTVKKGEDYANYIFAFKLCSQSKNTEETLVLGNKNATDDNTLTVYPKIVEGIK